MRPEEIYTVSVQKGKESFKKLWPTKNKFICGLVFAALAVGVLLMLNPIPITFSLSFAVYAPLLANVSFAAGTFGFTCGYLYDEKLSFWNNISFDGIKGYFQQPNHGKQSPENEVSKTVESLSLSQGYIIDPPERFNPMQYRVTSSYLGGIDTDASTELDLVSKREVKKDPVDQFVEKLTGACMNQRTSKVARRIIEDKISPPDHVIEKSSNISGKSKGG